MTEPPGENHPALPPSNLTDAELEAQWRSLHDRQQDLPLATRVGYYLAFVLVACVIILLVAVTFRIVLWIVG